MLFSKRILMARKATSLSRFAQRSFLLGYDNTNIDLDGEFRTKRVFKKYAPSKAVIFNFHSKEGNIAKIFEATHNYNTRKNLWALSLPASLGTAAFIYQTLGMGAIYVYAPYLAISPLVLRMLNRVLTNSSGHKRVSDMYLLQNGDQILLKTYDGVWHKVCIQDIQSYKMNDKSTYIEILIVLKERTYVLSTKSKTFINFEIMDKIMKGVCIQTNLSTSKARPPANISKEGIVTVDIKHTLGISSTTKKVLSPQDQEISSEFEKFGIPYYSESDFYSLFKTTRTDFLTSLTPLSPSQAQAKINTLYDSKTRGRKLNLAHVEQNVRKKLEQKNKMKMNK